MLRLSNQISDNPVVLPKLQILDAQPNAFRSAETTPKQKGDDGPISFTAQIQIFLASR